MSLARRLLMGSGVTADPGQVELTIPGTYLVQVPPGVRRFSGVVIAAGMASTNTTPFNGWPGGNLHWRNGVEVTPGEWLTVIVGDGALNVAKGSAVKRGADYLLRAENLHITFHDVLGGGGGFGGGGGPGNPGNGGLGGGGPGYTGRGGVGGNYLDTVNSQPPEANSGGGRGGDKNGLPYGWQGESGEGTGLLGRKPDFSGSLGVIRCGAGVWGGPAPRGQDGGIRLIWGGGRSYPDDAPDAPFEGEALFVTTANGSSAGPAAFTFHTDAQEGDFVLVWLRFPSGGSFSGIGGSPNWQVAGQVFWKQITDDDIAASIAGTVTFLGSGTMSWISATYRGPRVAVRRSAASDIPSADTVVVPGFTKRVDCQRVVAIISDPDSGSTMATPAGFTSRAMRTTPLRMRLSDAAPASYVDGAPVTYTGMDATTAASAELIELF